MSFLFFLLGLGGMQAQNGIVGTGGEASGSGGTVSYSVGQVVYTTNSGTNGSMAQGVQQPYEISAVTELNETNMGIALFAYPNPTKGFLTLSIENYDPKKLSYQLYDVEGKLLESNPLKSNRTTFEMGKLPASTYFLKVINDQKSVKTFTIIKN